VHARKRLEADNQHAINTGPALGRENSWPLVHGPTNNSAVCAPNGPTCATNGSLLFNMECASKMSPEVKSLLPTTFQYSSMVRSDPLLSHLAACPVVQRWRRRVDRTCMYKQPGVRLSSPLVENNNPSSCMDELATVVIRYPHASAISLPSETTASINLLPVSELLQRAFSISVASETEPQ
jgi:hypothetical protein